MNTLPERPSLEHLKAQAKDLLNALRSGKEAARYAAVFPGSDPAQAKLADAQHLLAREYGFESWPRLKARVEQARKSWDELRAAFIRAARDGDSGRAAQLLADHPDLARAGMTEAAFAGNLDELRARVTPQNVNEGDWPPLVCCCASVLLRDSRRRSSFAACVRWLLEQGADPNSTVKATEFPHDPLSALYYAGGRHNAVDVATILLDAGATPDDNECLYHACEHRDHEFLKLIISRGVQTSRTNALKRMLDYEDMEGLNILLSTDIDPNEYGSDSVLIHAIRRGRSPEIVARLIDAGADPSQPNGHGATPYNVAVALGEEALAEVIARKGGSAELSEAAAILRLAHRGESLAAGSGARFAEMMPEMLHFLAESNRYIAIRSLLAAGHPPSQIGTLYNSTPLHQACHPGHLESVRALLEYGARLDVKDTMYGGWPIGWAMHGAFHFSALHDPAGTRYREIVELLIAHGTPIYEPPEGRPDLEALLRAELERRQG